MRRPILLCCVISAAVEWSRAGRLLAGELRVRLATTSRYDAALHVPHYAGICKGLHFPL